jgi:NAD(P)-dependent dehydrogenase (short-subunit alcohol dehydrogenase family)
LVDVGYNVIMACRSLERGREAQEKVKHHMNKRNMTSNVLLMQCDLGSFQSVAAFAKQVKEQALPVNLLVCNAGVMTPPLTRTKEGYESQLGSNYLAHFLLVQLLLNLLKANGPSRILLVSSEAHRTGYLNWNDFNSERDYNPFLGYAQSKCCIIMFCYELHRYLKHHSTEYEDMITVNVLHPGVVVTNIATGVWFPFNVLFDVVMPYLGMKPTEGCVTTVYLCLSPQVESVSGKYFDHCQMKQTLPLTYDKDDAKRLWRWSMSEITRHVKEI